MPKILASPAYLNGGALFLVWTRLRATTARSA